MDSFESVIASLLERDGFWVRSSVKVELSKAEKRFIGRASSPRWELDLVAFKGKTNELWIVECKSFLDSRGVDIRAFQKGSGFSNRTQRRHRRREMPRPVGGGGDRRSLQRG